LSFFDSEETHPDNFIWKNWSDTNIPFLFNSEKIDELITSDGDQIIINYDIIASSFYFLSLWQEYKETETDQYGRYPFKKSFQYKYNVTHLPIVNYYFNILKTAIHKTGNSVRNKFTNDFSFTTFLSHDIDNLKSGWKMDSFAELKRGNIPAIFSILTNKVFKKDSWDNLNDLISLEKNLGVHSTYFFITEQKNGNADYHFTDIQDDIINIERAGSEVGIHGSLGSGLQAGQLKSEIEKFNEPPVGNRFHFLMMNTNVSPEIIEDSGLQYSCSLGFAEHVGFRNGFCFPYHPFNFEKKSAYSHIQIPLNIMDTTLRQPFYMGHMSEGEIHELVNAVIIETEKFGGFLSILWHNTYFTDHKYKGWKNRYIDLVNDLKKRNCRFLTGAQIAALFN
jgi:hypothetical protein